MPIHIQQAFGFVHVVCLLHTTATPKMNDTHTHAHTRPAVARVCVRAGFIAVSSRTKVGMPPDPEANAIELLYSLYTILYLCFAVRCLSAVVSK